jgi:hypothetical protein
VGPYRVTEISVQVTVVEPIVALLAGILILIMPRLLNYIVAMIYMILVGLVGLLGLYG